jgi:hypothetical protein
MPTTHLHSWPMDNRLDPLFNQAGNPLINVKLAPSLTLARGTILGELSGASAGTYAAYSSAATNGAQTPKLILAYEVTTDASNKVTIGPANDQGLTYDYALAYGSGTFKTEELTGLDANAVDEMNATLLRGDLESGIVKF